MKKTLTVNLAGTVYHIDEDAYSHLSSFLEALEQKMKNEENRNEIITDIEARISELLNEKLNKKREVVIMSDIDYVIETIGSPELIFDDDTEPGSTYSKKNERKYRRMYRDPDNRLVSGVCSGLAAYWHLDPTVVRVVFVALTILGASGLIIYLILLIILPEAQTTAQKLEMRGEPVTVENIKNFFADEFNNVKETFKKK
jgi:phage shock protein PspC (stress-responsive transcriptional regulator)